MGDEMEPPPAARLDRRVDMGEQLLDGLFGRRIGLVDDLVGQAFELVLHQGERDVGAGEPVQQHDALAGQRRCRQQQAQKKR